MWLDRDRSVTPDLLAMDQMFDAMVHLHPGVETVHHAIHRARPDAFTAAVFEFCDTGADMSSFAAFRSGDAPTLPPAASLSEAHQDFVGGSGSYSFISSVDELATRQAIALWDRTDGNPLPDFTFLALSLTDEAGHEAGPHSDMERAAIIDSDRRIARVLDAVDRSGARERTAFVLIADHGMEANDPTNDAEWSDVLSRSISGHGIVDVADGLVYLTEV
jgi:predicted AlkP superfamily pyrophosphatase or phosphodiesterase